MPISKSVIPRAGLILVILSIITLRFESSIFAASSFLMALFGFILILMPDLRKARLGPKQPLVRRDFSTSTASLPEEATDRCALCGRPVPPDVAYCDECAKKR
jgi:hypothetical protein